MANSKLVRMVSTGTRPNGKRTGYFRTMPNSTKEKLSLKLYDPVIRKHVFFKQEKIK